VHESYPSKTGFFDPHHQKAGDARKNGRQLLLVNALIFNCRRFSQPLNNSGDSISWPFAKRIPASQAFEADLMSQRPFYNVLRRFTFLA